MGGQFLDALRRAAGGVSSAAQSPIVSGAAQMPLQLGSTLAQLPLAYFQNYLQKFRAPGIVNQINEAKLADLQSTALQDPAIRAAMPYRPDIARLIGTRVEPIAGGLPPPERALPGMRSLYRAGVVRTGQPGLPMALPPLTETTESLAREKARADITQSYASAELSRAKAGQLTTNNPNPPDGLPPDQSAWVNTQIRDSLTGRTWVWELRVAPGRPGQQGAPGPGQQGAAPGAPPGRRISLAPGGGGGGAIAGFSPAQNDLMRSPMYDETARRYGYMPNLLRAVSWQESGFNPNIAPHLTKHGWVRGLNQFLDSTGAQYGIDATNWREPALQIEALGQHLRKLGANSASMQSIYDALVKYHGGGPQSVDQLGVTSDAYAKAVLQKWQQLDDAQVGFVGGGPPGTEPSAGQQPAEPAPTQQAQAPGQPPGAPPAPRMPSFQEINPEPLPAEPAGAPPTTTTTLAPAAPAGGGPQPEPPRLGGTPSQQQPPQLGMSEPAPGQRTQADWDIFGPAPEDQATQGSPSGAFPEPGPSPTTGQPTPVATAAPGRQLAALPPPERRLGSVSGAFLGPAEAAAAPPPAPPRPPPAAPPSTLAPSQQIGQTLAPPEANIPAPGPAPIPQGVGPTPVVPATTTPGALPLAPRQAAAGGAPGQAPPGASGAPGAPAPGGTIPPGERIVGSIRPGFGLDLNSPDLGVAQGIQQGQRRPGSSGVAGTLPVVDTDPSPLFPDTNTRYVTMPTGEVKLNPQVPVTPDETLMMDAVAHTPGASEYVRQTYTSQIGRRYPDAATARQNAVQDLKVRRVMQAYTQELNQGRITSANKVAQVARAQIAKDFLATYLTQVRRMDPQGNMAPDYNRDGNPRIALDALSDNPEWIDFSQQPLTAPFGQGGPGIPLYVQHFLGMDPSWMSIRQMAIYGDGAAIILMANLGSAQNAVRALGDVGNLAVAEQEMVMRNLIPSPRDSRGLALGKVLHFNQMLNTIQQRLSNGQTGEQAVRDVMRSEGQGYIDTSRAYADAHYAQQPPPGPSLLNIPTQTQPQDYQALAGAYNPQPILPPYDGTGMQ